MYRKIKSSFGVLMKKTREHFGRFAYVGRQESDLETARRRRKTSNEMNDSRSVTARGPNGRAEFKRIAHVGQETDAPYTNACNASSNEK